MRPTGAAALLAVMLAPVAVGASAEAMTLTSSAYGAGGQIPARFTCEGRGLPLPFAWSAPPTGTKSLALILEDPDAPDPAAPKVIWVHWVLYDLPPAAEHLPAGMGESALPEGTREGTSSFKTTGYGGPCPPIGRHRYIATLYALDTVLPDLGRPTADALQDAMQGHVLQRAVLIGTYQKKG
jgi:Raf kinase inhibitor-like YbhB/YbcL family protein